MPDPKVNVKITGTDELTPKLEALKLHLADIQAASASKTTTSGLIIPDEAVATWERIGAAETEATRKALAYAEAVEAGNKALARSAEAIQKRRAASAGGLAGEKEFEEGGEAMKELMAGITYNFGLWNVGMMASQGVLEMLTEALTKVGDQMRIFYELQLRMGGISTRHWKEAAQELERVGDVALNLGTDLNETLKTEDKLIAAGMDPKRAEAAAHTIEFYKKIGVDLTELQTKAERYKVTAEDILAVTGKPFVKSPLEELRPRAKAIQQYEDEKPFRQFALQEEEMAESRILQHKIHTAQISHEVEKRNIQYEMEDRFKAQDRGMEDSHRAASYEQEDRHRMWQYDMEDSHRATEQEMEDRFRAINREMEERFRAINREMEHRHMAAEREIEDRHRIGQESDDAEDRMVSRRRAHAELRREALATHDPRGMADLNRRAREMAQDEEREDRHRNNRLRREAESRNQSRGFQDESIRNRESQEDEAYSKRIKQEDEMRTKTRQMQLEELKLNRQITQEQIDMNRQFVREETTMRRAEEDERITTSRTIAAADLEFSEEVYNAQIEMQQRYQDARLDMERNSLMHIIELSQAADNKLLEMHADTAAKAAEAEKTGVIPGYSGKTSPEEAGKSFSESVSGIMKDHANKMQQIGDKAGGAGTKATQALDAAQEKYQGKLDALRKSTDDQNRATQENTNALRKQMGEPEKEIKGAAKEEGKPSGAAAGPMGEITPEGQRNILEHQLSEWSRKPHVGGEINPMEPGGFYYEGMKRIQQQQAGGGGLQTKTPGTVQVEDKQLADIMTRWLGTPEQQKAVAAGYDFAKEGSGGPKSGVPERVSWGPEGVSVKGGPQSPATEATSRALVVILAKAETVLEDIRAELAKVFQIS